jgi:hypothetical protein
MWEDTATQESTTASLQFVLMPIHGMQDTCAREAAKMAVNY